MGYVQKGGKASRVSQSRFFSFMILSIHNIISMFKQKLSDLFLRKESRKEEPRPVPTFDESYFDCQILTKGTNTELIRVKTRQKQSGEPLDEIRCRWYIKSKVDFREIEEVTSEYYQPCLDDVGSSICVQVDPAIEGRKYTGITIMMDSPIITLDHKLEEQLEKYLQQQEKTFSARIEAIFSQSPKYSEMELPLDVKLELRGSNIALTTAEGKQLQKIVVSQDYPNIEFIRKSFSSILFNFNDKQSMKLGMSNNFDRDLFTLITRTCAVQPLPPPNPERKEETQQSTVNSSHSLRQESGSPPDQESLRQAKSSCQSLELEKRSQGSSVQEERGSKASNSTMLVLKLDEQGKEIKHWKRKFEELQHDYNLEKQSKNEVEAQIEALKLDFEELKTQHKQTLAVAEKVKRISEDNRFYKNQISITKKDLKSSKERVAQLQGALADEGNKVKEQFELKLQQLQEQLECTRQQRDTALKEKQEALANVQGLKETTEELQNENEGLHRKISTIAKEKHIKQVVESPTKLSAAKSEETEKIRDLQMKLKNLEMLLRYRSGQGEVSSNFQMLVANLTETVTQKELQIVDLKKVNKSLLEQLQVMRANTK